MSKLRVTQGAGRIAAASTLLIAFIAAALVMTVLSYRSALDAHHVVAGAINERSASHTAETYLSREREAMNEYLLNPREEVRAEIRADQAGFASNLAKVGVGEPDESSQRQRAIAANEKFLAILATRSHRRVQSVQSFRRLEAELDAGEKAVLLPLQALRSLNADYERNVGEIAHTSSRRALLFAIFAGMLAVGGGLAFAVYAARLVERIRFRNERLSELDRMKDDFVASVSHELRTPLTSIRGYLDREGDAGELTDEQHQFVAIVERNADRLLRLVGDLLFVAQVEAGKITLDPGPTDIEELVRQAVDAARPAAAEKGIAFDLDLDLDIDGMSELHADRARLGQVLDNLISNALKFTRPGGHVAVRTSQHAEAVLIEVSDDGMGMSHADVNQLFERFFRTTSATEQAIQGTGLGLAIVKAIVEAHDGVITVESVPGEGTRFRVELPRSRELVAA
ncbi:MAG: HAMP domain-containing histidine kinase [Actinomycetota bacterium]|nr:HAMP domain-containing histidine kinase [Actinomycetota bacterium]